MTTTPPDRKALRVQYEQTHPEAEVYRIVDGATGKALLGSTANLPALRNTLAFAHSGDSPRPLAGRRAAVQSRRSRTTTGISRAVTWLRYSSKKGISAAC